MIYETSTSEIKIVIMLHIYCCELRRIGGTNAITEGDSFLAIRKDFISLQIGRLGRGSSRCFKPIGSFISSRSKEGKF